MDLKALYHLMTPLLIWGSVFGLGACEGSSSAEPASTHVQSEPEASANDRALVDSLAPGHATGSTGARTDGEGGGPDNVSDEHSDGSTSVTAQPEVLEAPLEERVAEELPAALTALAQRRAFEAELNSRIAEEAPMSYIGPRRRTMMRGLYEEVEGYPVFVSLDGTPHARLTPVLSEMSAAYQHALDMEPYRIGEIENHLAAIQGQVLPREPGWALSERLADIVGLAGSLDSSDPSFMDRLARSVVDRESTITGVREQYVSFRASLDDAISRYVDLELELSNAFLSYTYDMAHFNVAGLTWDQMSAAGGEVQLIRERMRQSFRLASISDASEFAGQLEALIPQHPQYTRMMASRARYESIVEAGGWSELRRRRLSLGSENVRVEQLKQRLTIEGYYEGPIDQIYDEALLLAVSTYQSTHQLDVTGEPHDDFWESLNVSAERRLQQIEITLHRWRMSRFADEDYYIFVNLPAFAARVYRNDDVVYETRVVVGSNRRQCDPETGTEEYVNATPLLRAEMEYLVFNPYWNVPLRIWREELDPEIAEDPQWLAENNYEVVVENGRTWVRQLPGEDNALGQVKFIFPNDHGIYLHDTPQQRYFEYNIRAFSHGCVRVFEPMNFAEFLLDQENAWDPERIQRILEGARQTTIHLEEHIPIYVEYYVVEVDDEGHANFLADVYRYDRALTGDYEPAECTPEPVPEEPLVVWHDDGSAVIPDGRTLMVDGTVLEPEPLENIEAADETTNAGDDPDGGRVINRLPPPTLE